MGFVTARISGFFSLSQFPEGNLPTTVTDTSGITTTYAYGSANDYVVRGIPNTITNAKGTVTTQTIDTCGRTTNVSVANTAKVGYTYSGGNLSKLTGTDLATSAAQSYSFFYNAFGNMTAAKVGSTGITYSYDASTGLRMKKTVGTTAHQYYYLGDKLVRLTIGSGTTMDFVYDASGNPYAVVYNGTTYYYVLNQQGDVVRLVTAAGTSYGTYRYDAWGKILYQTDNALMNANPLRYRGYVYDSETGFYYVSSRYYDPEIGRFINADSLVSTGQGLLGNNMFAYCRNNPVCRKDVTGTEDVVAYNDGELLSDDDLDERATGGGGGKITLYRAVSPAESNSATTTQRFSSDSNSYEGSKFFATSQADAQKWGDAMYKDGNYEVISGTFYSGVTTGSGVIFYPRLDGIGPAYLIPISALNESVIMISCVW